jgi:hypothetical protein
MFAVLAPLLVAAWPAPAQFTLVNVGHSTTNYGGTATSIVLSGNYAYLRNGGDGLRVYDISNPGNPTNIGYGSAPSGPCPAGGYCLAISGNYAYMGNDCDGLHIFDISNPTNIINLGNPIGPYISGVVSSGNHVYLAGTGGLRIYDASNPTNLVLVGQTNGGGALALSGDYAYMASGNSGLRIYNISNPTNPVFVSQTNNGLSARGVAVSGNYAYLANDGDGLRIYDVSNPANPMNVGHINNGGSASGVSVSGHFACLANFADGLRVYNVSNPANPTNVAHSAVGGDARAFDAAIAGNYIYLADGLDGLRIYLLVPQLSIGLANTNTVQLSWPVPLGPAFVLQQNSDLTTANWSDLTNMPTVVGNWNQVMLPQSVNSQFYRLKYP